MRDALSAIVQRYDAYLGAEISPVISEHDDMFARGQPGALEHYLMVGRSAIDMIARSMIATEKTECPTVLDLPCGGGRVTRHLVPFFPESRIFVGELDDAKRAFVADTLGAEPICPAMDFSDQPERRFDIIFVGSLVTHFNSDRFKQAVNWFIAALAPDGLLILTTHGRRHDHIERTLHHYIDSAKWGAAREDRDRCGFGYVPYDGNPSYGVSLSAPSWVMRLVENDLSTRVINFQEAAWGGHQDTLVLQKRRIEDR